ncbi:hypothetical protein C8J56DRAFT_1013742 [Mycena floridula]|nr:hypothetical protein C8J56DRAFT_1013742 [Mycena floridula]
MASGQDDTSGDAEVQNPLPEEELEDVPRRSTSYYFVLLFLVAPLWCVLPVSWAFVLWSFIRGFNKSWLYYLALLEVAFSIYYRYLVHIVQKSPPYITGNPAELQMALARVLKAGMAQLPINGFDEESLDSDRPGSPAESIVQLERDDPRAIDFRNTLRNWFRRAPFSSIRMHEVKKWVYWSIFSCDMPLPDQIPHSRRLVLDDAVELLQKRMGVLVPEGTSLGKVEPLRLTLDDVSISWRPLTFYALITSINWCLKQRYRWFWGLHYDTYDELEYLIRRPSAWNSITGPRPIVVAHGLGLGLLQYTALVTDLVEKFPDRPLLILIQPHISQNIFHPRFLKPFSRHEMTGRLAGLLQELGWVSGESTTSQNEEKPIDDSLRTAQGVTMLSHSNGSYCHAWMLKGFPEMISRSCFVDPVTFCSWEGDVCYNFVYRSCTTGIQILMRYFVGSELGVANLLQRHFDWSSNSLFFEDIPNAKDPKKVLFVIGGKDAIVNTPRVIKYLSSHGIRKNLWVDPSARHGQALISGQPGHTEILRWLAEDSGSKAL